MPCSCASCQRGIKNGPAQLVALCGVDPVVCGGLIDGTLPITGSIDAAPSAIASPSAQDLIDFEALTWTGGNCSFVDAYTTWPTDRDNILTDNGLVWPIGDAANFNEGLFKVTFADPFTVCPTTEINIVYLFVDYTAEITLGTGVLFPGVWFAWRKADTSLVQLIDLGGASTHGENVRMFIPADGTITAADITSGYGLVGLNLTLNCGVATNNTRIDFDYISMRYTYDASSCYDPATTTGSNIAMPVVVVCDDTTPVVPTQTYTLDSVAATLTASTDTAVNIGSDVHLVAVYNPSTEILPVTFTDTAGSVHRQRIPPSGLYSWGVGDSFLAFGTTLTFTNPSASDIDVVINTSTTTSGV